MDNRPRERREISRFRIRRSGCFARDSMTGANLPVNKGQRVSVRPERAVVHLVKQGYR